jgi:formylglycine-generating enzyme required for sulfatase activity
VAVSGPQSAKYKFEITAGQLTVLVIDRASYQVVRDNADARAQQAAPMPMRGGGYDRQIPEIGLDLVWIAPGEFLKNEAKSLNAISPAKKVSVTEGFWLGRTEVTQAQQFAVLGHNPNAAVSFALGPDRPLDQVSWEKAMEFCRVLTERERVAGRLPAGYVYSLPTEAQWELAARAGDPEERMTSARFAAEAWTAKNSGYLPQAVDGRTENPWGLADMFGNVSELCFDWDAQWVPVSELPKMSDPFKESCAVRGGSFETSPGAPEFAYSGHTSRGRNNSGGNVGFRIVLVRQASPTSVPVAASATQN